MQGVRLEKEARGRKDLTRGGSWCRDLTRDGSWHQAHELVADSGVQHATLHVPAAKVALLQSCMPGTSFIANRASLPSRKYCSNNLTSGQDHAVKFSKATAA